MSEVLSYQQFQEAMDSVNPKAVKKKFKDRKDKDIDNDGDVDSSDKYLHKRRKAISKAVKEDKKCPPGQYYCEKSGKCKPNSMKEETLDEEMPASFKAMLIKRDKMKKAGQNIDAINDKIKKARADAMRMAPNAYSKEEKLKEGKYGKYSDLLLKKQRMKKMGQNTMVVDKEIEAEKKKLQSAGPMKTKTEEKDTHKTKDGRTAKKGLYYNINKKKKSGKTMRKKGEKGAPSETDFANAKKTAQEERENCHSKDHDCATVVEHIVWGFGKPVYESHAVPTDDGYVSWYDVEFEHGIEKEVPTEDLKIYTTEAHEKKDKDKKKMLPMKKGKHSDEIDEGEYSDAEISKAVDIAKKMAGHNYTGATNAINKMKKGLASVGKVKYALKKAAESFETFNGLTISEVEEIVSDLTNSAQDYIKLVESGDLESADEPEVEPVKGMPLSFKQFKSKIGD